MDILVISLIGINIFGIVGTTIIIKKLLKTILQYQYLISDGIDETYNSIIDIVSNNIESKLYAVIAKTVTVGKILIPDIALKDFIQTSDLLYAAKEYKLMRSYKTYGEIIDYCMGVKQYNADKYILGKDPATIQTKFSYAILKQDNSLEYKSYPSDMIEDMKIIAKNADLELIKQLEALKGTELNLASLKALYVEAFRDKIYNYQLCYLRYRPDIIKTYANTETITQLVAENKIDQAINRLIATAEDAEQQTKAFLLASRHAEYKNNKIYGVANPADALNKIKKAILEI